MGKTKDIKEVMNRVLLLIGSMLSFLGGAFIYSLLVSQREKKMLKDFYNEKRKNFDARLKASNDAIDSKPIDELLKDGEYLRRQQD